jgi:hypothetical protein
VRQRVLTELSTRGITTLRADVWRARARHYGDRVNVASLAYWPVGFGSHHWELTDAAGII